jgi:uncharacterized membrane protein
MSEEQQPGRLGQFLEKTVIEEKVHRVSLGRRIVATFRNRVVAGLLFLLPITVTAWFVNLFLTKIYKLFEPKLRETLELWQLKTDTTLYHAVGIVLSVIITLIILYLVGLITARTAVKRLVHMTERVLVRIPFVKFFYKTTKQIVDALSVPTAGGVKKVCVIEFFRTGMKTIAFVTGETRIADAERPYVNLFVPTTPNPTSGYLVVLPPEQVFETDLTLEEAMTFIVSGGILPPDDVVHLRPYQSKSTVAAGQVASPPPDRQIVESK